MRRRASHPTPHVSWIFPLPSRRFGAARRRHRSAYAHEERILTSTVAENRGSENRVSTTFATASGPTQLKEREGGGRNAGRPACACALPIRPRRFTLENHQSAASIAAIVVRQLRRPNVFGAYTFVQIVVSRNEKTFRACEQTVEDETSLWRAEENKVGYLFIRSAD